MSEREDLEQAIVVIEAQRPSLSDAAVDAVLAGLRRRLAELGEAQSERSEAAGKPASSSERRIITVLFADVKDSTAMADKLDPETWTEIMDRAYKILIDPVDRFGGTVAQLIGDAVVAFFGAPTAHEDDPQRAIEAGLAILENIRNFREELAHRYGLDFNVRVGINTGLAVAGRIGSQVHEEYTALGDAVNLAARMEQTAEPGTIQITDNTYRLVASLFDCRPLGGIDVKGKSEPVAAYRVVGHKAEVGPLRGLSSYGVVSPYIGRAAELATAKSAFESVLAGRGHILMIIGEAGIGKSRLLAELRKQVQSEDITWLNGRTLSFGQEIGYLPFQDILRQFSGIHEEDGEAEAWRKLESSVQNLLPQESPDILPYLAGLMALEARGKYAERVKYLDGDAMREQISLASRRFFKQLASEQPLVLVFEDLHWIDASSVRLLESLLPLSEQTSLLFCFVTRPEPNPAAEKLRRSTREAYGERFSEIRLSPLTRADSAQLVRALLEDDDLSTRARDVIVNKADGNPFFLEEIIRNMIETGAITQHTENGRWRATSRIDMIDIPDTIQGVITARIDRFDERVKRVLRSAAVIGHSFYLRVLGAVLETEPDLDQQLSTLQMAELIREKQRLPELEYIFKHALAQDVAYSSILLQTRRDLHARVGHAIEHLFEDRLEEFYSLLAYHYAQAQAWETAQDYLLKAGDQAVQVAADTEALAHYQRALKAYENAFGSDWDPLQRARLARKMGEAHYGLGQLPESRDYFQDALALLGKPLPKSRSGLLAGLAGQVLRQALHRLLPSRFVNSVRGEKREALREMVRSYERLGVIFYIEGQAASSVYAFLRSLNLAEPAGPSPELARAYANNVVAASLIPPLRFMADQYSELAVETAGGGDDLAARAWVWQMTGIYNTGIGRWPEAIKAEEEAVELNQRIGRLRWWGESIGTLAQALHLRGDFARSREKYQALYISSYERGDQQTLFWALAGLIETGLRLGGPDYLDELTGYIEEAQAALDAYRHPNRPDQIQFNGALAQVRLRRKEWALAEKAAATAGDLIAAERPPSTFYTMEAYAGIPLVYLGLWEAAKRGQYGKGREESFKKLAYQACRSLHGYARVFPIAEPRAWLWQGVFDWRDGRPSKARQAWQKSADGARRLAMPYDLALAEFEIGRHLAMDDPQRGDCLERAARRFAELGAAWDLQRVGGKEQGKESKGTY